MDNEIQELKISFVNLSMSFWKRKDWIFIWYMKLLVNFKLVFTEKIWNIWKIMHILKKMQLKNASCIQGIKNWTEWSIFCETAWLCMSVCLLITPATNVLHPRILTLLTPLITLSFSLRPGFSHSINLLPFSLANSYELSFLDWNGLKCNHTHTLLSLIHI